MRLGHAQRVYAPGLAPSEAPKVTVLKKSWWHIFFLRSMAAKSVAFVVVWHNNDHDSKRNVRCGRRYICDAELCARALQLMHASANASYVMVVTVMEGEK